jgi:hypothetical protein
MSEDYNARLTRVKALFEHARGECTDPDCEIHNPWMQEDEVDQTLACAYFVAGAQWSHGFIASQLDEMHERAGDDIQDLLASPERMEQAL